MCLRLFCFWSLHPLFMFGNWDHCFVCYDVNLKLDNCVMFVFWWLIISSFYNGDNVNLVLSCPWSLFLLYRNWSVVTQRSIFFHVCVYMLYHAGQWSINNYPIIIILPRVGKAPARTLTLQTFSSRTIPL